MAEGWEFAKMRSLKLNYRKKAFYFALNLLPWDFLLIKKKSWISKKLRPPTDFETDMIKLILCFSISNFFTNKIPREGN